MGTDENNEKSGSYVAGVLPPAVELYASWLAAELSRTFEERLRGVYVHGSAAMGGWHPNLSDVDILAVIQGPASDDEKQQFSAIVQGAGRRPPGTGLEFSLVSNATFAALSKTPSFELHLTTGTVTRVVDGAGHPGDPDLVLHYSVCRQRGIAAFGPHPSNLLPSYPRGMILATLAAELEWARANAPSRYAVLNACRAWAFAAGEGLLSKIEGGEWALRQGIEPATVEAALEAQRGNGPLEGIPNVGRLVDAAVSALGTPSNPTHANRCCL